MVAAKKKSLQKNWVKFFSGYIYSKCIFGFHNLLLKNHRDEYKELSLTIKKGSRKYTRDKNKLSL